MTSKTTKCSIVVTQGDTYNLPIEFKNLDITGATLKMQVRDVSGKVLIDNTTSEHINPEKGLTAICLTKEETNIPIGDYETDIEINMPDGSRFTFYPEAVGAVALFVVTRQITKE